MKKQKMNGRFRAGFILALVSFALVVAAILVGYLFEQQKIGAAIGAGAALCATVGIILTYFGKPQKPKPAEETAESSE